VISENIEFPPTVPSSQGRGEPLRASLAVGRVKAIPVALSLAGIVIATAALRFAIAWRTSVPWTVPDELVHSELARSFAATGHFAVRDHPFSARSWGPLYLLVIAPAFRLGGSLPHAYLVVKAINCLLMSAAAVPAYLLARRFLDRRYALILAMIAVLVPSGIYTAKIMAESLAYPLFLFAALATLRVLERRTAKRELVAISAILVAALARAELIVMLPAFVLALTIVTVLEQRESAGRFSIRALIAALAKYRLTCVLVVDVGLSVLLLKTIGFSPAGVAGGHGEAFGGTSYLAIAESFVLHLAELDVYLMMLPVAALAILSATAFKRGGGSRESRAFLAFTISLTVCIAAVSARYLAAVYHGSYVRAYDRYTFYLVPLFLIAFLMWLREGRSRPRVTAIATVAACGAPLLIPFSHLLVGGAWGANSSAVSLIPWAVLRASFGAPAVFVALLIAGAYLAWLFIYSRNVEWLVALVIANVVAVNLYAAHANLATARAARNTGIGAAENRSWIDAAVGANANVIALWSGVEKRGTNGWWTIWENELLNRSVRRVFDLRERLPYNVPEPKLGVRGGALYQPDGTPLRADYVLTDAKTPVVGLRVAVDDATGMAVYEVRGKVRLRATVHGPSS
jgi:hypothetical protein